MEWTSQKFQRRRVPLPKFLVPNFRSNFYSVIVTLYCLLLICMNVTMIQCFQNSHQESRSKHHRKQHVAELQNDEDTVTNSPQGCVMIDGICIAVHEVASYEAIKAIHAHLDDDHSGDIDISESVDFLREELNYTKGFEKRQKAFHYNNDQHISVQELWSIWLANEVHNWTVEQTVGWLHTNVELGQYADGFYENAINGSVLPRLAASNTEHYLTRILGIRNSKHKSKISIKAMDIVLFGPPKGSIAKDIFIAGLIIIIIGLLFKFRRVNKNNNNLVKKMEQEMENLQDELLRFNCIENVSPDSQTKQSDQGKALDSISQETPWENVSETADFDNVSEDASLGLPDSALDELQLWLQLTYEREKLALESKVIAMKKQLEITREMCDKMKPNKMNLFGAFSFMHGRMEFKGQPVMEAKTALAEIQAINKEMMFRWSAIERLVNASVTVNPGLDHLQLVLEPTFQDTLTRAGVNSTVGMAPTTPSERGTETPTSTISRQSTIDEVYRARKHPRDQLQHHFRPTTLNEILNGSSQGHALPPCGTLSIGSRSSVMSSISHSQTVGSGLSNLSHEDLKLAKDAKKKFRGFKTTTTTTSKIQSSNSEDKNSSKFTVGDNDIRIPPAPPNRIIHSSCENQTSPTSLSPSNSQPEDMLQKLTNKFSSEPSLDLADSATTSTTTDSPKSVKKSILGRPKLFSKFRSKMDKQKS